MFKEVHVAEDTQEESGENRVFLSMGSNLGDPEANLESGLRAVAELPGVEVVRCSRIYRTEPQGVRDQPWFANLVVELRCSSQWTPESTLQTLLDIEQTLGRTREVRWGPRTIDIDILVFGSETRHDESLEIPHPRMHSRAFVLVPLAEIAPDLRPIPGRGTVKELLEEISYHVRGPVITQQE